MSGAGQGPGPGPGRVVRPGLIALYTRYRLPAVVVLIGLIVIAIMWGGLLLQIEMERHRIVDSKLEENGRLARLLEEHVVRTLRGAEMALQQMALESARSGKRLDLAAYAREHIDRHDPYTILSVLDDQGAVVSSSIELPAGAEFRSSDSYRHHSRHTSPAFFISAPRRGTVTGKWTVYLSLRINRPDGSFGGMANAGIDAAYFSGIYQELDLGKDSTVSLVGRDGIVRMRLGGTEVSGAQNILDTPLFTEHLAVADHGSYVGTSMVDNVTRIFAYRTVSNYPLVVVIGTSRAAAIGQFDKVFVGDAWVVELASAVILLLVVFVLWQMRKADVESGKRRRADQLFRTLADRVPVGIFRADERGRPLYANRRWLEIVGAALDGKAPQFWREALHPDDRERLLGAWDDAIRNRRAITVDFRLLKPDGTVTWVVTRATPETDPHGLVLGYIGTMTDVTDDKRREEEIRQLNAELEGRVLARTAELEAANQDLETFSYSVAHDLKSPLRGIDGYSRLLLLNHADRLDQEGREFLDNIVRATKHMSQLLEDLLAYSRLERRDLQVEAVDPQELVAALLDERAEEIRSRGVAVTVVMECRSVRADREGLSMALRNLLENALKFSQHAVQPAIEIGGHDSDGHCILFVRDNGVGFDMKFHDRIFDIFQRLNRSEEYPGTGVGLAIVKKAMERMGGRVWAESKPGQGATFFLEIPE